MTGLCDGFADDRINPDRDTGLRLFRCSQQPLLMSLSAPVVEFSRASPISVGVLSRRSLLTESSQKFVLYQPGSWLEQKLPKLRRRAALLSQVHNLLHRCIVDGDFRELPL